MILTDNSFEALIKTQYIIDENIWKLSLLLSCGGKEITIVSLVIMTNNNHSQLSTV